MEQENKALAEARAEAAKMKDAWLRTAADFDNFRKQVAQSGRTCRRCGKVNPAPQEDCPAGAEIPGAGTEPHDLISSEFAAGVEAAAKLVERHCCVSTCCDAQPGASTAEELARCIRKNVGADEPAFNIGNLLEAFVAWLDKDDMRICERAWGENRPMEHAKVSEAVNDFIADHLRSKAAKP